MEQLLALFRPHKWVRRLKPCSMPYPGGPRVRFLVLAGCFSFKAASPLSPPFNKLLPPLGGIKFVIYARAPS